MAVKRPSRPADPQLANLRVPPHSLEAEQSVLGGLMLDNQAWEQISEALRVEDFYLPAHRTIFRALQQLAHRRQPLDVLTVAEALKMSGELDNIGGELMLYELVKNTPSAANITAYAQIVRDRAVLRQLIEVGTQIIENAYMPGERSPAELLDEAERLVFRIAEGQRNTTSGPVPISRLLTGAVERIDTLYHAGGALTGLTTGYVDLDNMTSGLQSSDLIIVAGRPAMGKTTFAMNIAEFAAMKSAKSVLIFSMEMSGDSLAVRILSSLGRIDQHRMRTGKLHDGDWPKIQSAVMQISDKPLFIDDTPALNPNEIRTRARRLIRDHGPLGLIVIDYLQLMRIAGFGYDNRTGEISEISRSLKTLARELNVPIIALSQLNRGLEQRPNKRPMMSDLRESGAIEQDADLILFIYRDEVYHPDSADKGKAEIIIGKQRNGPIGTVTLTFLGKYTRFENHLAESFLPPPVPLAAGE